MGTIECKQNHILKIPLFITQLAKFLWPTWGTPGSCRTQMGPMLAPWTLLSGNRLLIIKVKSINNIWDKIPCMWHYKHLRDTTVNYFLCVVWIQMTYVYTSNHCITVWEMYWITTGPSYCFFIMFMDITCSYYTRGLGCNKIALSINYIVISTLSSEYSVLLWLV